MQINLQFSEREYLRGKASEIRFSEQKTKFPLRKISVCLSMSARHPRRGDACRSALPLSSSVATERTEGTQERTHSPQGENIRLSQYVKDRFSEWRAKLA